MSTKVRGEISCPLKTTKECTSNLLSDLSTRRWGFLCKQAVLWDLQAQLPWGNVRHSTGGCLVWLGYKTPVGASLGGRIMQDLCFSSPIFCARHVAWNLPALLLDTVLDIFGDSLMCCPCWDPCRTAELFGGALPHNFVAQPLLHRDLHKPLVLAWKRAQPSVVVSSLISLCFPFFAQL